MVDHTEENDGVNNNTLRHTHRHLVGPDCGEELHCWTSLSACKSTVREGGAGALVKTWRMTSTDREYSRELESEF